MKRPVIYGRNKSFTLREFAIVIFFAACIAVFCFCLGRLNAGNAERQRAALEDSLTRTITECYAEEGRYPQNLGYLEENYGLIYDSDLFYVDYQVRGSNIRPVTTIIQLSDRQRAAMNAG